MKKRDLALCVIFSIITFGIYGIYWAYKMVKQLDSALMQRGIRQRTAPCFT